MNHLSKEKSPYLLQHKDNPVHWYPWSDKAFAAATAQDKPIFLSIGYATCHWCHVMEHESFEDKEVAAILNRDFISIKVDREERPDVDHIYMTVAQLLTGSGGWPLTIVMTPQRQPFFAATYIPKTSRFGRTGLVELLDIISSKWKNDRAPLIKSSTEITDALKKQNNSAKSASPSASLLDAAFARLAKRYDPSHGGFSRGTKFPTPHNIVFLLRYYARTKSPEALLMAETTLQNMRAGGIYDHIGYGFHRYSTDSEWLVPHFEKMLYDQALLVFAYAEAYEATGNPLYAKVIHETATYLERKMISPEGAFYSAEDADSEGIEGQYYVWSHSEIQTSLSSSLPNNEADVFIRSFHIQPNGNFESHQTPPNTNIPHLKAAELTTYMTMVEQIPTLENARQQLLDIRNNRIPPLLDDKILTDWNGLMIAALAKAGRVLHTPKYIQLAQGAAAFFKKNMARKDNSLWHRYREGDKAIEGQLDDYAFLIFGLIELYQATFDAEYLQWAMQLEKRARTLLAASDGSYYLATNSANDLIVRPKEFYDGALPSGNSVMLDNISRLSRLMGNASLEESAAKLAAAFTESANRSPDGHTHFMLGLNFNLEPSQEVVVVGEKQDEQTQSLLTAAFAEYYPNRVALLKTSQNASNLAQLAPFTKSHVSINNAATGYVCVNHACSFPTNSPEKLKEQLQKLNTKK